VNTPPAAEKRAIEFVAVKQAGCEGTEILGLFFFFFNAKGKARPFSILNSHTARRK